MPLNRFHIITEIIAALFILLFTYTSFSKLLELQHFKVVLSNSPLIGKYARIISIAIPIAELITALLLFIPKTRLKGLYASLGLMSVFTGYIAYMIAFTPALPCSCGGVIKQLSWNQHLLFNIFFLLLSIIGIILYRQHNFLYINRPSRKPV